MKQLRGLWLALFVLVAFPAAFTGCKTEDELTARPWNAPQNWETGLPAALTEGR